MPDGGVTAAADVFAFVMITHLPPCRDDVASRLDALLQQAHRYREARRLEQLGPVTLAVVWSYSANRFFSTNISGAQRLPNGNTLITAGVGGRMFEVTNQGNIVWEYLYPSFGTGGSNAVYRAYRLPYYWIPQLQRQTEKAVVPPANGEFRVP